MVAGTLLQVFFLTENLLSASGDDFSIKDANNPSHFYELKSSAMSMKGSRVLKDAGGKVILSMKHKVPFLPFAPSMGLDVDFWAAEDTD